MNDKFALDISEGLSASQKHIPFSYFYNERGTWLFQQIMQLPEYYLTDCETTILEDNHANMLSYFQTSKKPFNLIDLGAGDGSKTKILLKKYIEQSIKFSYTPIDLSTSVLSALSESLDAAFPNMPYQAINKDYWDAMEELSAQEGASRKVVLFLGSNIGNFSIQESIDFLAKLKTYLSKGDLVLIGFDLKKRPEIIYNAYLDTKGTTAAFNLNLLHRINEELGGNFKTNYFRFYPTYNPQTGELNSYLVSQKEQTVSIEALELDVKFGQWEAIHTELSQKYTYPAIQEIAKKAGYQIKKHYEDPKSYFVDSLFEVC